MNPDKIKLLLTKHYAWVDSDCSDRIAVYLDELRIWNDKINLTGLPVETWLDKIVAESLTLLNPLQNEPDHMVDSDLWMDMGTGAGIPGLVIAAAYPRKKMILVDSRRKKTDFIRHAAAEMDLTNVEVVSDRLEHMPEIHVSLKHNVSAFFSRALGDVKSLVAYADPMATRLARLISPRGGSETEALLKYSVKNGRSWFGDIRSIDVAGFNRRINCAIMSVEVPGES